MDIPSIRISLVYGKSTYQHGFSDCYFVSNVLGETFIQWTCKPTANSYTSLGGRVLIVPWIELYGYKVLMFESALSSSAPMSSF